MATTKKAGTATGTKKASTKKTSGKTNKASANGTKTTRKPTKAAVAPKPSPAGEMTSMPLSKWFQQYEKQAETVAQDPTQCAALFDEVNVRLKENKQGRTALRPVKDQLATMMRVVQAAAEGRKDAVSWNTLTLSTAGLLYLTSPGDFVPDWVPEVGMADDAAVIGMVYASCQNDLTAFEKQNPRGLRRLFSRRRGT